MDPVVTLTDEDLVVEPGSEVMTVVRIRNTSDVVEEYDLSMLGEAAAYTEIIPTQVSAYVGEVAEATVIFRPPYDSLITSGQVPFAVRAQSREDADRIEIAEGELTLGAINLLAAKIIPARAAGRWRAKTRVEMHNRGTEDLVVRLRTLDPDEKLSFALSPREIEVPPDGTAEAFLKIRPRKSMVVGSATHLTYQVSYRRKAGVRDAYLGATSGGETEAFVDGSFEQKPIIAKWMMAVFALVLLIGGLVIFRAQTTDIEAVVANPVPAPLPPTGFDVAPSIDELTISWEPPAPPPTGYTIISADPERYAGGEFDPITEDNLEVLGPQDRAFDFAVEGGTTKCLFIQSFFVDPDSGETTQSVIVGMASPSGLLTSNLPDGNCVSAQRPDECAAPVITGTEPTGDPTIWTVSWTYGEGCDTADEAVWTLSVNGEDGEALDEPERTAANVDLSGEAVLGEYVIRVSPGPDLLFSEVTVTAAERDAAIQQKQDEDEIENAEGRAPEGAYAIVYSHFPSEKLPVTAEPGDISLAGLLEAVFNIVINPDLGPGIDRSRVYYGPVSSDKTTTDAMTLVRLPESFDTDYYLVVDGFSSRGPAVTLCEQLAGLVAEIEADFVEFDPTARPPEGCRAFGPT